GNGNQWQESRPAMTRSHLKLPSMIDHRPWFSKHRHREPLHTKRNPCADRQRSSPLAPGRQTDLENSTKPGIALPAVQASEPRRRGKLAGESKCTAVTGAVSVALEFPPAVTMTGRLSPCARSPGT